MSVARSDDDFTGPTKEIGHSGGVMGTDLTGVLMDTESEVAALTWPQSVITYHKMRRDAQITSLYNGLTIPIRAFPWSIDPNGADDDCVQNLAYDMGLPIVGEDPDKPIGRRRNRFSHDEHLQHALLALLYGHMFCEQYGEYDESTAGDTGDLAVDFPIWRLLKLAPRMPKTISEIKVARDGGLVSIRQHGGARPGEAEAPPIPVSQLVAYVWGKEGANWFGRPLLESLYGPWLIKDRLKRVDAIKHERTGAGIPIIEAPPGASVTEIQRLDAMAQRYKVGEAAGGAIPAGTKFRLVGVEGATSDVLASIRYQDEAMSNGFFQEVKTLGQTAYGSRALGLALAPFFVVAQQSVALWYERITNEHVIEDWVDINYGPDAPAPRLVHEDPTKMEIDPNGDVKPGSGSGAAENEVIQARAVLHATEPLAIQAARKADGGFGSLQLDPESAAHLERTRDEAFATLKRHGLDA